MITNCDWCGLEYDLTPETEQKHLEKCPVFQTLSVEETGEDGQHYVRLPGTEILCERRRKIN